MNVGNFIGKWSINFTTGPLSQPGEKLADFGSIEIGTGKHGAAPPSFSKDYAVQVGFALLDTSGGVIFFGGPEHQLTLVEHQLQWHGPYEGQELNINIALAEIFRTDQEDRGLNPFLFGCTVYGDPDQVGVWGASGSTGVGNPPPAGKSH